MNLNELYEIFYFLEALEKDQLSSRRQRLPLLEKLI
jgi:hypothetical protein